MEISHSLQCSICLEDFKQPKFLDCHHTFCLECLRGLENKTPGFINCPLCQREVQLPSGGVDKLTTNFYIQNTTLAGVEDGKTVPTGVENGKSGVEGIETVSKGVERREYLQNVKRVAESKTIELEYPANEYNTEIFGSVSLKFLLFKNSSDKWGETLALRIFLPKMTNPFVQSCQVEYDITLVNQKDRKFSTKRTGQDDFETNTNLDVDLIKMCYATDVGSNYGFTVSKRCNGYNSEYRIFHLVIDITVSNITNMDFNLK